MKSTGIAILIIGFVLTIFTTFNYITREKVVDLGAIELTTNKPHNLSWSPLIGIAIMGIGGVVVWMSYKKGKSF